MASDEAQVEKTGLKHLGFVEIVVDAATKYVASVYEFAKGSSGPLKPGVESVESTVKTIVGPVYEKIDGKPHEILLFVDSQVDNALGHVPQTIKDKSSQVIGIAMQAPELAKSVVTEVQSKGFVGIAKSYYEKCEPVAGELSYEAWKQFLKVPYAPKAVHVAAPPTLFCAEKFNQLIGSLKARQIPLVNYIPDVPVDKLERALKTETSEEITY